MDNGFNWEFIDENGTFMSTHPQKVNQLYFPICNEAGLMSSVSPFLGGDSKKSQNEFLYLPVSIEDLHNNRSSRNFWLYTQKKGAFSVTGNSMRQRGNNSFEDKPDNEAKVEGGFLYHTLHTKIEELSLACQFTTFCPANEDFVEINLVSVKNEGNQSVTFVPTAAFPIFGRSADNIRDHRHVTSLMHRIRLKDYGIVVKPTIHHDERGHQPNDTSYFVYGATEDGEKPEYIYPTAEEFIGGGGTFDWPRAVVANETPDKSGRYRRDGMETIGALKFKETTVAPGKTISYIICAGITEKQDFDENFIRYNTEEKARSVLKENKEYWKKLINKIKFSGESKEFDGWIQWVELQPILRKIYGCSFLPYHDYGRGGRGWRDLWQDYLTLLLQDPQSVRDILVQNCKGVRIDGSNATIILQGKGKFLADRNKVSRVWMDHGAWPFFTIQLYINQTGDIDILDEKVSYWRDQLLQRSKKIDLTWENSRGNVQLDKTGEVYNGTVLEHLLLQNLICYFNVGEHGNIKLEDGDWNDQLDLAPDRGETIPFTAFYAMNLSALADMLLNYQSVTQKQEIEVYEEMLVLLNNSEKLLPAEKQEVLFHYYQSVEKGVSTNKKKVYILTAVKSLKSKSQQLLMQVRNNEWIEKDDEYGFFNGYYNNDGKPVDGFWDMDHIRLGLTAQTFTIMSGTATDKQIERIIKTVNKYLSDPTTGGLRLTMPLGENTWNLGRGFALVYGEKETGGMFSHMTTMYAYALYKRGYVKEGYQVLSKIFKLCLDAKSSEIYPGIPEYINDRGKGLYSYVTGAGSWTIFTMLTQVYGIHGDMGDLVIEPKLTAEQFSCREKLSVETEFAKRRIRVVYKNSEKLEYGIYKIGTVKINNVEIEEGVGTFKICVPKHNWQSLISGGYVNEIYVELTKRV